MGFSLVELLKLLQVHLVQCPGVAAAEQSGDDNRVEDDKFGGFLRSLFLKTLL